MLVEVPDQVDEMFGFVVDRGLSIELSKVHLYYKNRKRDRLRRESQHKRKKSKKWGQFLLSRDR